MRFRWINLFFGGIIFFLIFTGCTPKQEKIEDLNKLQIYTTNYPLEYFTQRIGSKHVQVHNLVPVGVDPHEFEPSPKNITRLAEADLLVYNGAGFEPWVEKIGHVIDGERTQKLDTSKSISMIHSEEHHHNHHEEEDSESKEEAKQMNPHVWLDPQLAKKQASEIKQKLISIDPKHKKDYEKNYQQLATDLDQLDKEFSTIVKNKQKEKIVVSHDAFAYLAKRYGFEQIPISGLSSSDEPSPKELQQIVEIVKKNQLKVIFFETLGNKKLVQTVQRETGVKALLLHPLEGLTKKEKESGADFFSIMNINKENLKQALESR